MAAAVGNGRIDANELNTMKKQECNGNERKSVNGKIDDHKNGHVRTDESSNGVKKRWLWAEGAPLMDWARYDTSAGHFEDCSLLTAALTNFGLLILMLLGYINQFFVKPKVATEANREGYAPLYEPFEQFFSRYVYRRVRHCFNKPISSAPGALITVQQRHSPDENWTFRPTGVEQRCINLGSYDYLGYAGAGGETSEFVRSATVRYGLACSSSRAELGSTALHRDLERELAAYLGTEAAVVFGMGFATNTLSLPALLGPDTLVLSDEKNHASLILGLRLSRATVRVFRHNDLRHLERLARAALAERRWAKVVVVVEGVYSMEGSVVPLRALVALKRHLGLYLYLDEAHSVGAMGARGRGITDFAGVDPRDVDVLMGTFTKSFGAAGGYIAGSAALVRCVRAAGHAHAYAHSMAPPVAAQVLAVLRARPHDRIEALAANTTYFRHRLRALGGVTFGHERSPVVPLLVYTFSNMAAVVERLAERGVAAVGVGFPATPLSMARIRFCMSASHSRAQLDACLAALGDVMRDLGLDYSRRPPPPPLAA